MSQVADAPAAAGGAPRLRDRLAVLARDRRAPVVVLAVLSVVAAAILLYDGRQTLFYFDEWDFVLGRRGTNLGTFLDPHVGHFSLVPILVYKALFATVGLEPYWPYRAVVVGIHLISVWLLYAIARPRFGGWGALIAASLLLFLGAGNEALLWPFEMSFGLSIASGLGAWLLLRERSRARDVAASFLVLVSVCSSGIGVPFALAILVALAIPQAQRRRVWVAAVPIAIYLLWLFAWGIPHNHAEQGGLQLSNLPDTPLFMATSAATAIGGIAGLGLDFGRVLLGLAIVVVVWRLMVGRVSAWLAGALIGALAFWGLTALGRADLGIGVASSSRYTYVGAVLILLVAVYLPLRLRFPPRAWALVALATVFAVIGGLAPLRDYGRDLRRISDGVAPALAAVQIGAAAIPADNRPELALAPQIFAGKYRAAVAEFGSPLPNGVKGVLANPNAADVVDAKLASSEGLNLAPARLPVRPAGAPPAVVSAIGGTARRRGACVRFTPTKIPAALDLGVAPGTALAVQNAGAAPVEVRLRRFGPDFPQAAFGVIPPHGTRAVGFRRDTSPSPWIVRISPADPVVACAA